MLPTLISILEGILGCHKSVQMSEVLQQVAAYALNANLALARFLMKDSRTIGYLGKDLWKRLIYLSFKKELYESLCVLNEVLKFPEVLKFTIPSKEYEQALDANRTLAITLISPEGFIEKLGSPEFWMQLADFLKEDTVGKAVLQAEHLESDSISNLKEPLVEETPGSSSEDSDDGGNSDFNRKRTVCHVEDVNLLKNNLQYLKDINKNNQEEVQKLRELLKEQQHHLDCLISVLSFDTNEEIDFEKYEQILPVAVMGGMKNLVKKCCSVLQSALTVLTCFWTFRLANNLELHDLRQKSLKFINENFVQIYINSPDFCKLSFQELSEVIFSEDLSVDNEGHLFYALVCWVMHDTSSRTDYFPQLFVAVRLPCCSLSLLKKMHGYYLVRECPALQKSILSRIRALESGSQTVIRRNASKETMFVMGGWKSLFAQEESVQIFDVHAQSWQCLQNVKESPSGETHVVAWRNIALVIEYDNQRVRAFDPLWRSWTRKADNLTFCEWACTSLLGDEVFLIGGFTKAEGKTSKVQVYNFLRDSWREVVPLSQPRSRCSATTFKGRVYCSGGVSADNRRTGSVVVYDYERNKWDAISSMSTPRNNHSLASCERYVWAFGGVNVTGVERYDPNTGSWREMKPMLSARCSMTVTLYQGVFYLVGGRDSDDHPLSLVETFDPLTSAWAEAPGLQGIRYLHGTFTF